ncbi:transposase [Nocardia sp. NPDC005998]|uniref:transposase n=1 Tax=Nocardia sp. NPDC005998 TaxID=3156894 RepID=UPI0033A296AE
MTAFAANAAWLQLADLAYNLTCAAGAIAALFHAKAAIRTIRAGLIDIPARLASSGRQQIWHLAASWPAENAWRQLFDTARAPSAAT